MSTMLRSMSPTRDANIHFDMKIKGIYRQGKVNMWSNLCSWRNFANCTSMIFSMSSAFADAICFLMNIYILCPQIYISLFDKISLVLLLLLLVNQLSRMRHIIAVSSDIVIRLIFF